MKQLPQGEIANTREDSHLARFDSSACTSDWSYMIGHVQSIFSLKKHKAVCTSRSRAEYLSGSHRMAPLRTPGSQGQQIMAACSLVLLLALCLLSRVGIGVAWVISEPNKISCCKALWELISVNNHRAWAPSSLKTRELGPSERNDQYAYGKPDRSGRTGGYCLIREGVGTIGLRQQDSEFQVIRNIHEMEEPPVLCKAPNSEITVDSHSNNAFIIQSIIENNSIHRELTTAGTR